MPFLRVIFIALFALFFLTGNGLATKNVVFPSIDSLPITADLYMSHPQNAPFILLFHRAGWSRGEYLEIAPRLNKMGFNCMAVDLRSGGEVNNTVNLTASKALEEKKTTGYLDAIQDINAAIDFARKNFAKGKLMLWGSSYSASLVLKIAGEYQHNVVDGVLAFSPGEYFVKFGKPANFIANSASNIKCPVFITSAKAERRRWMRIFNMIMRKDVSTYVPIEKGFHGSMALWKSSEGHRGYWLAVGKFLARFTGNDH